MEKLTLMKFILIFSLYLRTKTRLLSMGISYTHTHWLFIVCLHSIIRPYKLYWYLLTNFTRPSESYEDNRKWTTKQLEEMLIETRSISNTYLSWLHYLATSTIFSLSKEKEEEKGCVIQEPNCNVSFDLIKLEFPL